MRFITPAIAASLALTATAWAQPYADADTIVIEDFFGSVELELSGDGDVTIAKSGANASDVSIGGSSDRALIRGEGINRERWKRTYYEMKKKKKHYGSGARDSDPAFEEMLKDQPKLIISAPEGTAILVRESAIKMRTDGDAGDVVVDDNIHVLMWFDDIENGELQVQGSGYLEAGNIDGLLEATVHGSGDLIVGNVREAELTVHGSGDLRAQNIGGELDATVHGSGDLKTERVLGPVDASVHGSGDLVIRSIERGLEGSVHGSGDLKVGSVTGGDIEASVHGSGDFDIDGGNASRLVARVNGSGEFKFGGTAETASLRSSSSGEIRIGEVTGRLEASGKDIRVGGAKVGDDEKKSKNEYH